MDVLFLLLGIALGLIIIGALTGAFEQIIRVPCKRGHKWERKVIDGQEQLYCEECKHTFSQIVFDKSRK